MESNTSACSNPQSPNAGPLQITDEQWDLITDPTMQGVVDETFGAIAVLIPVNHPATVIVSDTVAYLQDHKEEPAYKHVCDQTWGLPCLAYSSQSGYYILSRRGEKLPRNPADGWIVGGSSRDGPLDDKLDFPLLGSRLPGRIFSFRFAQFGITMLHNLGPDPITLEDNGSWICLSPGKQHGMCQDVTTIQAYGLELRFQYTIWMKHIEPNYQIALRNRVLLRNCGFNMPPPPIWPFSSVPPYRRIGDLVICEALGSGGHGIVSRGVDIVTGEYIAIKDFKPSTGMTKEMVLNEAKIGMSVKAEEGLLPTLKISCKHGVHPRDCRWPGLDEFFLSFPIACFDFAHRNFLRLDDRTKLKLFYDTLKGLRSLHSKKTMHRDVFKRNMMVLSTDPMQAVLCDFGRSVDAMYASSPLLGPWGTVAPEVCGYHDYDHKVDAWSWAYAVACLTGYDERGGRERITRTRHGSLLWQLQLVAKRNSVFADLVDLLLQMLKWDDEDRMSVTEACEHDCGSHVRPEQSAQKNEHGALKTGGDEMED